MTPRNQTPRERGRRLLSRFNRWAIAGAVGLAGMFSFVAAETTHGKTTGSTTTTTLQQPASTPTTSSSSTSSNTGSTGNTGTSGSSSVVSGGS